MHIRIDAPVQGSADERTARVPVGVPTAQWFDEPHFRRLVELLPVALYTCEAPSGRITFYNQHAAELWGRAPRIGDGAECFCGSYRLWLPDGSPLTREQTPMAAALRDGEATRNAEVIIERPDGSRVWAVVNIDPIRDATGRVIGAINVFTDATARRQAEVTRAHLAAIVASSDDAIISKDLDGLITSWNAGAERLFGYTAAEAIGQPVLMLIPPERYAEEPDILARIRRGEPLHHFETVRQRRDGTCLDISLTVSPIVDADGAVVGASKIARDISERKRAEAQREELLRATEHAREQAEAANRAKDEFLAMLGHELRNPLSAVRNAVASALLDPASRDRALDIARRQSNQLARIVDDLLDIGRVTRGRIPLRLARVSLADVLQRTVDAARAGMEERGHAFGVTLPGEPIPLMADATRLEQAVGNLLANAAKYTDPRGRVWLEAARDGEEAVIRIRDTGIGIAADVLPQVFELFSQSPRTLDRTQGGLGIGLALVRRIVELHGGCVTAHSAGIGHGAEFVVRLPALPPGGEATVDDAAEPAPVRGGRPVRLLIVEDNPDVAESLQIFLELLGHRVRVAGDGMAALATARAHACDAVLIDIGLPGMNGYELARAMRADPALRSLVLVALTGYGRAEDKAEALAAGFDHHLPKPADLDVLRGLLEDIGAHGSDGTAPSSTGSAGQ